MTRPPAHTCVTSLDLRPTARVRLSVVAGALATLLATTMLTPVAHAQATPAELQEQITAVREQLRVCRSVVFSIPSDRYPRQDVGNERLMPPERWRAIVERAAGPGYAVRARYYRGDLEAIKYSVLARRWLGSFSVLVTVDPQA